MVNPQDLAVLDELEGLAEEEIDAFVEWAQEAMRAYFRAGCRPDALAARVDGLLPIFRGMLVELRDVELWGAENGREEFANPGLRLGEEHLRAIDENERHSAMAGRLVAALDKAMTT